MLGAATAAHQVEGNNIHSDFWVKEHLKHSGFSEPSNDCVDHYHRYEEDIKLLAKAGLNTYRFSIEWARIEPRRGKIAKEEIEHYRKVLACCKENNVTPIVTLFHFSSPAWLMEKGGWGKEFVINAFARYCRLIGMELGADMPYICTINEANMGGQLTKVAADMMKSSKKEGNVQVGVNFDIKQILFGMFEEGRAFHCSPFSVNGFLSPRKEKQEEIVMKAHQAAVRELKKAAPASKIGLSLSLFDYQPLEGGDENARQLWQEDFGFYLPYIRQDDFLGVQNYSRKIVGPKGVREPSEDVSCTQMGYEDYSRSIGNVLRKVAEQFPGELIVTENGIATADDTRRCAFIEEALDSVKRAIDEGAPVKGYCHWSLLDNFEWQAGYAKTFGLVAVDRKTQRRMPKKSLEVLGSFAPKCNRGEGNE